LASRKAYSGLRNKSLKRHIDTVRAEKMLQFKPPAAHTAFQQARRRSLHLSVVGGAAIFGYINNYGLQDSARASCPCGKGRYVLKELTSQLHNAWRGR
jgi:hypothetical protein